MNIINLESIILNDFLSVLQCLQHCLNPFLKIRCHCLCLVATSPFCDSASSLKSYSQERREVTVPEQTHNPNILIKQMNQHSNLWTPNRFIQLSARKSPLRSPEVPIGFSNHTSKAYTPLPLKLLKSRDQVSIF